MYSGTSAMLSRTVRAPPCQLFLAGRATRLAVRSSSVRPKKEQLVKVKGKIRVITFNEMESQGSKFFTDAWNEPIREGGFEVRCQGTPYLSASKQFDKLIVKPFNNIPFQFSPCRNSET